MSLREDMSVHSHQGGAKSSTVNDPPSDTPTRSAVQSNLRSLRSTSATANVQSPRNTKPLSQHSTLPTPSNKHPSSLRANTGANVVSPGEQVLSAQRGPASVNVPSSPFSNILHSSVANTPVHMSSSALHKRSNRFASRLGAVDNQDVQHQSFANSVIERSLSPERQHQGDNVDNYVEYENTGHSDGGVDSPQGPFQDRRDEMQSSEQSYGDQGIVREDSDSGGRERMSNFAHAEDANSDARRRVRGTLNVDQRETFEINQRQTFGVKQRETLGINQRETFIVDQRETFGMNQRETLSMNQHEEGTRSKSLSRDRSNHSSKMRNRFVDTEVSSRQMDRELTPPLREHTLEDSAVHGRFRHQDDLRPLDSSKRDVSRDEMQRDAMQVDSRREGESEFMQK